MADSIVITENVFEFSFRFEVPSVFSNFSVTENIEIQWVHASSRIPQCLLLFRYISDIKDGKHITRYCLL